MSDHRSEEMKGRAKERAGDATDDEDLKREGKKDKASATAKEKANRAIDKAKDALNRGNR